MALVAGEAANMMEGVDDHVIVRRTMQVLRGIFSRANVPEVRGATVG